MWGQFLHFINPIAHLGETRYSLRFPFLTSLAVYIIAEVIGYSIIKRPNDMGNIMIFVAFVLVLYFSFRSAIKGGVTVAILSASYFIYFIYSRHVSVATKVYATETAGALVIIYFIIAFIIGWLKQSIDTLLSGEIHARLIAQHEQKHLQAVVEQLPVGVIVAEASRGRITNFNQEVVKIFGIHPSTFITMKDYGKFQAFSEGKKLKAEDWPLAHALLLGETVVGREIEFTNTKVKTMTLLVNAAPVKNSQGEVIGAVTTLFDITKQKDLDRQKEDLIAATSHELKTPLTSMKVFAQILEKRFTQTKDTKAFQLIAKVNGQLAQLTELIQALLDTSKLEAGTLKLNKKKFFLKELVEEITEPLQQISENKLVVKLQDDIAIYADKERIRQVLTNLITNAIKYSPQKTDIIIRSRLEKKDVIVRVQDFGIGVPKEHQQDVFSRFFRVKAHETYPGLGLGLYLSSEILKKHNGNIWVESNNKKGSIFSFSLPIKKEE